MNDGERVDEFLHVMDGESVTDFHNTDPDQTCLCFRFMKSICNFTAGVSQQKSDSRSGFYGFVTQGAVMTVYDKRAKDWLFFD